MTTEQMDWLDDERAGRHAPRVILNPDEPAPDLDPEQHFGHEDEHTHHSNWARRVCAAGDHEGALAFDGEVEREKVRAHLASTYDIPESVLTGETTMASEPREHAERRQWLDGYLAGFREGFERAGR